MGAILSVEAASTVAVGVAAVYVVARRARPQLPLDDETLRQARLAKLSGSGSADDAAPSPTSAVGAAGVGAAGVGAASAGGGAADPSASPTASASAATAPQATRHTPRTPVSEAARSAEARAEKKQTEKADAENAEKAAAEKDGAEKAAAAAAAAAAATVALPSSAEIIQAEIGNAETTEEAKGGEFKVAESDAREEMPAEMSAQPQERAVLHTESQLAAQGNQTHSIRESSLTTTTLSYPYETHLLSPRRLPHVSAYASGLFFFFWQHQVVRARKKAWWHLCRAVPSRRHSTRRRRCESRLLPTRLHTSPCLLVPRFLPYLYICIYVYMRVSILHLNFQFYTPIINSTPQLDASSIRPPPQFDPRLDPSSILTQPRPERSLYSSEARGRRWRRGGVGGG